ncbi:MAG: hypothetical protein IPN76_32115 [Saprospiraceae bacterium]|nr:hypothetical protein [Saprospiraceae bacterium]
MHQFNQIPDKVNPLVRNNPKLPKVVALYDKILKPLDATKKETTWSTPKFWHRYAKYCLEGSEQQALQVLEAFKELSEKNKVEIAATLTAFALLQTGQINVLLDFTEKVDPNKVAGVLIPRAFALAELERMTEAHETLTVYFDKLERFEVMHLAPFLNFQSVFTPTQELKETQWSASKAR